MEDEEREVCGQYHGQYHREKIEEEDDERHPDDDNDGVLDVNGRCQFSVLPEIVPRQYLEPNHYADIGSDGYFESANSKTNLTSTPD